MNPRKQDPTEVQANPHEKRMTNCQRLSKRDEDCHINVVIFKSFVHNPMYESTEPFELPFFIPVISSTPKTDNCVELKWLQGAFQKSYFATKVSKDLETRV